ncbi:inosine/xanthosine triphosphatase [Algoriphagus sp. SE2]|uniref:inosine/xanthosine triphosphatase n=1 Tax=Algoriphagus sp. SE2 TaxID=3141536 RepID=UPI0031CD5D83
MKYPKRENFQASEKQLIIVGSKNPVKINCTETAFSEAFSRSFLVNGVNASSGVSDQPFGSEETFQGAKNRAQNAKKTFPEADFWVGIEGGIEEDEYGMFAFAWIYIENGKNMSSQSKTGTFYLPEKVRKLVKNGMELGEADDLVFEKENSKQKGGSVGILTHGVVDRKAYYSQAIILALIPFLNKNLF